MARTAKVTDFPYKGRGTNKGLSGKGANEPKRTNNLRAADAHVSSVRGSPKAKKGPMLHGGGMLNEVGGAHPIAHLGNNGGSKGQKAGLASFRSAAAVK